MEQFYIEPPVPGRSTYILGPVVEETRIYGLEVMGSFLNDGRPMNQDEAVRAAADQGLELMSALDFWNILSLLRRNRAGVHAEGVEAMRTFLREGVFKEVVEYKDYLGYRRRESLRVLTGSKVSYTEDLDEITHGVGSKRLSTKLSRMKGPSRETVRHASYPNRLRYSCSRKLFGVDENVLSSAITWMFLGERSSHDYHCREYEICSALIWGWDPWGFPAPRRSPVFLYAGNPPLTFTVNAYDKRAGMTAKGPVLGVREVRHARRSVWHRLRRGLEHLVGAPPEGL